MNQSAHDIRRVNWLNFVNQCQEQPSDMLVKQWLAENDIKEKAYYYWLHKFRKEACGQIQLPTVTAKAEVAMPVPAADLRITIDRATDDLPAAVIWCNGLIIEFFNDISEVLLSCLLKEFRYA